MHPPFPDNIIAALAALDPTWYAIAVVAIAIDLLTGFFIKGVLAHAVNSSAMREGLKNKAWEVALLICAALVDVALGAGMGLGLQPVGTTTCAFITIMEATSVCENALEGNPDLASAPIIRYVAKAKKSAEEGDNE